MEKQNIWWAIKTMWKVNYTDAKTGVIQAKIRATVNSFSASSSA